LLGGSLADRFGGRQSGAVALLLHIATLIAWAVLGGAPWQKYAIFALSWMALQMGVVAYMTWFSGFAPSAMRGRVLGLVGALASLVSALGPQLGTWLRSASLAALNASGIPRGEVLASSAPFGVALSVVIVLALLLVRMPGRQEAAELPLPR
jgi:MFS family permease